jgi:hypothetical protein
LGWADFVEPFLGHADGAAAFLAGNFEEAGGLFFFLAEVYGVVGVFAKFACVFFESESEGFACGGAGHFAHKSDEDGDSFEFAFVSLEWVDGGVDEFVDCDVADLYDFVHAGADEDFMIAVRGAFGWEVLSEGAFFLAECAFGGP